MSGWLTDVWREDPFWMIEVQGLGVTQAETLSEIVPMASDLAGMVLGLPVEKVRLDISFRRWLPEMGDWVCQRCLKPNQVWHVPDEMWSQVVREWYQILCLTCFIGLAQDGFDCGVWRLTNEIVPPERTLS